MDCLSLVLVLLLVSVGLSDPEEGVFKGLGPGEGVLRGLRAAKGKKGLATGHDKSPRAAVVILFDGSQGSSYFIEMLAQLEEVCIVGYEPLSAVQASGGGGTNEVVGRLHTLLHTPDFEAYQPGSLLSGLVDSREHLDKCSGREAVFGLKARLGKSLLTKLLRDPSFASTRFLLLRRNYLKQAVATLRRKDCGLGQFNLRMKVEQKQSAEEIQNFKTKKCVLNPQTLRQLATFYARQSDDLAATLRQHRPSSVHSPKSSPVFLEVAYEDMVANMTHLIANTVAPFLHISSQPKEALASRPPSLVKASPSLLCQSLENYDQTCKAVRTQMPALFLQLFNEDACNQHRVQEQMEQEPGQDHNTSSSPIYITGTSVTPIACCPRC